MLLSADPVLDEIGHAQPRITDTNFRMSLRRRQPRFRLSAILLTCVACLCSSPQAGAAEVKSLLAAPAPFPSDTLSEKEWKRIENSVDQGLAFLAGAQAEDGSFPAHANGQPGITSLAVMAFLSRGHTPGDGPYATALNRAIEFTLATQRADGLICKNQPENRWAAFSATHTGNYNHAISGMMLAEIYGMSPPEEQPRIREAITAALEFTLARQQDPKRKKIDEGGWRYLREYAQDDSDLSVTAWQLMFLRSAKNAEFDVPQRYIDDAMGFIKRRYSPAVRTFLYADHQSRTSAGVVGSAIVSMSMGGLHESDMARDAGDWILLQPPRAYNSARSHSNDRYHYSMFYSSQAMFHLGGHYWSRFYPRMANTLLLNQRADGSWPVDATKDAMWGNSYSTALAILSLTPPFQLLPIYQR